MGRFHRNDHLRLMHSGFFGSSTWQCISDWPSSVLLNFFFFTFLKWWLLFVRVFVLCFCLFSTPSISFFARFPLSPHFLSFGFWMANKQTHNSPRSLEPHGYNRFSQGWNRTKLQSKQRRPGRKGIGKIPQGLRCLKMFWWIMYYQCTYKSTYFVCDLSMSFLALL